jgi:PTH1 family peptidyl-tRNA hydrolase
MKVVVGLGNPGKDYKDTRHNIGFMVLEELAARHRVEKQDSRFDGIIAEIRINGEKVLLVKPLTYMNLSGKTVQPLLRWYKLDTHDLMVIYDDMDLPVGTVRVRPQGGTGGHKGMASIVDRLATTEFARTRLGIGHPQDRQAVDWVLGRFTALEKEQVQQAVKTAADVVEKWVKDGIDAAMNAYN